MFSALIAPYGATSFLKEGYIVYGFANAAQYTERYYWPSKKQKSKVYTSIQKTFILIEKANEES